MRRRTWIKAALAVPATATLPAVAQQPLTAARSEFGKIDTVGSAGVAAEPVHKFFSAVEYAAVERLADAIMPSLNGKPGALAAGVPAFVVFLISQSPAGRQ